MPAFIVAAVSAAGVAIGGSVGAFLIIYATQIVSAALLIGSLALSSAAAQRAKNDAKNAYNASQVDRLVNTVSTIAPRELVLGRVRTGGFVFFQGSAGVNKTIFCRAIALAGHEIAGVDQIYLNDVPVTLDGQNYVTTAPYNIASTKTGTAVADAAGSATLAFAPIAGSVTAVVIFGSYSGDPLSSQSVSQAVTVTGQVVTTAPNANISYQYSESASRVRITVYTGTGPQPANARLIELFPTLWTANHRGDGIAYLLAEFTYDETVFAGGLPTVSAVVRGARVFDPRNGLTLFTENPALLLRHVYQHADFGKGVPNAAEDARITAAANACDITHGYVVDGVTTTRPMFSAGVVAPYGTPANALLDDLAQAMGGMWAFAGGEIYAKAGIYTAPAITLAEADLAVIQREGGSESQSPITISPHRARASKFNTVKVQVWDQAQAYKAVTLAPLVGAALVARDGAQLVQEVKFSAIGYAPQALHVAGIMMRDARDPLTVQLPFKLRAYPVELFDTVAITIARYGWAAKTFLVMGREWSAAGFVLLTLKETGASIYQPDAAFLPQGYEINTQLPKPWFVPEVGPLTVSSGDVALLIQTDGTVVNRIRVSWPAINDTAVTSAGQIEVQHRRAGDLGAWASVTVPGNETQVFLQPVHDRVHYIIRARARTSVAVGNWSLQVQHLVASKQSGPANYDVFDMTFGADGTRIVTFGYVTTPIPRDLAGARIKFVNGFVASPPWASMAVIDDGLFTAGFETIFGDPGNYTVAIKAVDTSGNESTGTIYIQRSLPVRSGSAAAQVLRLAVTGYAFVYEDDLATASPSPDLIFNAVLANISGIATFVATAFDAANVSLGTITLGGAGSNTRTLTSTQFNNAGAWATAYVKIVATLGSLSDTTTVYRGNDGSDGLTTIISNEAHTVPTAFDGTAGIFTGAGGIIKVFRGITDVTSLWSFTATASGAGGTFNGSALPVTVPVTGVAAPAYAATSMSADAATITITATRAGFPMQTKVFSLAKSKTGTAGAAGAAGATGATGTAGTAGAAGAAGAAGSPGQSARRAYVVNTSAAVPGAVTQGTGDVVPTSIDGTWSFAATSSLAAGQYMYQVDGLYTAGGNIAWGTPYLANLKVGSLSAISANMGTITAGTITGALIRTAASGARVEIDSLALNSYDASNNVIVSIKPSGANAGLVIDTTVSGNTNGALSVRQTGAGQAIRGHHTSNGVGVFATSSSGIGLLGTSDFATGGKFQCNGSNFGADIGTLNNGLIVTGPMAINNATLVGNLNADLLDGQHASEFLGVAATAANSNALGGQAAGAFLGVSATAANANALGGRPPADIPYYTAFTAGDPGTPTHTVTMVIQGTTVRFHVSFP